MDGFSVGDLIKDIATSVSTAAESGGLGSTLQGYNSTLYNYAVSIMQVAVMPVAYTILAIFLLFELLSISASRQEAPVLGETGSTVPFKVMFKAVICVEALTITKDILGAIFEISLDITTGVSGIVAGGSTSFSASDVEKITDAVDEAGWLDQIGIFIQVFIIWLLIKGMLMIIEVIVIGRFIEIFVMMAVAPIPIATFAGGEMSQIGKNFLKNFAAVCLQGSILYIVISFFPVLFKGMAINLSADNLSSSLWEILLSVAVLFVAAMSASRWAKSICNAM